MFLLFGCPVRLSATSRAWTPLAPATARDHGAESRLESLQSRPWGLWFRWSWLFLWPIVPDVLLEGKVCKQSEDHHHSTPRSPNRYNSVLLLSWTLFFTPQIYIWNHCFDGWVGSPHWITTVLYNCFVLQKPANLKQSEVGPSHRPSSPNKVFTSKSRPAGHQP